MRERRASPWPRWLRLLARFPIVSVLICALLGWSWLRSQRQADIVAFFTPSGCAQALVSDRGRVAVFFTGLSLGRERGMSFDATAVTFAEADFWRTTALDKERTALGFGFQTGAPAAANWPAKAGFLAVEAPYWALMSLAGLLLCWRMVRFTRHVRRVVWQFGCMRCGYDLRASVGRCPECGEPIARRDGRGPATTPTSSKPGLRYPQDPDPAPKNPGLGNTSDPASKESKDP